ncbi:MAG: FkbM family methyltransferase [Acidobacteriota bacterium]|nr:FkbM family methyltransferase [Acidobacteriota bacterium]
MTIKKSIARMVNRALSPFDAKVVAGWESNGEPGGGQGNPSASSLRIRLFEQIRRKGFMPTHILDVGAHRGEWSRDAHKVFPESALTLIEPQTEMRPHLERFCSEAKNAHLIIAGAGASEGELPFTVASRTDSSSFAFSEADAEQWGVERRMVPVVTLDSVCEESTLPIPEMVKIDAEGLDLEVIKGSQKLIGVTELFFVELPFFDYWTNQSFHMIVAFMRECGYEPYDITDLNRRHSDGALALMEVAFAKKAGVLRDHHGY